LNVNRCSGSSDGTFTEHEFKTLFTFDDDFLLSWSIACNHKLSEFAYQNQIFVTNGGRSLKAISEDDEKDDEKLSEFYHILSEELSDLQTPYQLTE
jgi:hypothetical protein